MEPGSSLLAYWRLGEASGTVAADQRGSHEGTYAYNPTLGQPGALFNDPATSVGFNGTSQYVQAPTDASLNTSTFSFEVWARPTGGAGSYRGVMADRFFPHGWNLGTLNAWHHVVGTCPT